MKISLNWISEFVKLEGSPEQLATKIAEHCFEVEKIIPVGQSKYGFSNVFTAKVLAYEKHPNADRLRVVKLELADKIVEPVVCGANNFEVGDVVALAVPGARIPQNVHTGEKEAYELGKAKIRGVESQGMICSAFELGLVSEPETKPEILILKPGTQSGIALEEFLGGGSDESSDVVFDLSLPANRPDLHSHYGIARELSAILGFETTKEFEEVEKKYSKKQTKAGKTFNISIEDLEHCRYYFGAHLKVKVGPSPEFIVKRLQALGMRSINNVVDITNYVMAELGQPMHAFDAKTIEGDSLIIRAAKSGESIETLDHKQRKLEAGMLLITDSKKPLAIAAVMGGVNSEVADITTEVFLESANFEQFQVRKTSKTLNLRTDASALWEKGVHPRLAILGANRALELLFEYADAEIISMGEAGKVEAKKHEIKFTVESINNILGTDFSASDIKKYLQQAGMDVSGSSATVPYNRTDMENYADLADEVARIAGMNNIARVPLQIQRAFEPRDLSAPLFELKQFMVSAGFNEIQSYSFVSEQDILNFGESPSEHLKVKNPLSGDQGYLKKHLLVPVLKNIQNNLRYFDEVYVFEIGKTYLGYMQEPEALIFSAADKNLSAEALLARIKGTVDALVSRYTNLGVTAKDMKAGVLSLWLNEKEIGEMGVVSPQMTTNFEVGMPVAYAKMDVSALLAVFKQAPKKFSAYSKFQNKVLDISLLVSAEVQWQDILEIVQGVSGALLQDVQLFESPANYGANKLPKFHKELAEKGLKNLAFHMVFQSEKETLKDSEILPIYAKIQTELKARLNAEIR